MTPATVPDSTETASEDDVIVRTGMQETIEHKTYPTGESFEVKQVDMEGSEFVGDVAGIGNRDRGDDIIMPGAFDKSIRERVENNKVKLLNHHQRKSIRDLWGVVLAAEEVALEGDTSGDDIPSHMLRARHQVSRKQDAQDALADVNDGILDAMSIGLKPVRIEFVKDNDAPEEIDAELAWLRGMGVRRIHELAWWESSLVIWGMNEEAEPVAGSVKSLITEMEQIQESDGPVTEKELRYAVRHLKGILGEHDAGACLSAGPVKNASQQLGHLVQRAEDEGLVPNCVQKQVNLLYEEFKSRRKSDEVEFDSFHDFIDHHIVDGKDDCGEQEDAQEEHPSEEDAKESDMDLDIDELKESLSEEQLEELARELDKDSGDEEPTDEGPDADDQGEDQPEDEDEPEEEKGAPDGEGEPEDDSDVEEEPADEPEGEDDSEEKSEDEESGPEVDSKALAEELEALWELDE